MNLLSHTILLLFSLLSVHYSVGAIHYRDESREGDDNARAPRGYQAVMRADDKEKGGDAERENKAPLPARSSNETQILDKSPQPPNGPSFPAQYQKGRDKLHRVSSFRDLTLLNQISPPVEAFFPATFYIHYTPQ